MISDSDLKQVAQARLEDSIILALNDRYEGAIYLCGLFSGNNWRPDYRYKRILGRINENLSFDMIESAESLIGVIL